MKLGSQINLRERDIAIEDHNSEIASFSEKNMVKIFKRCVHMFVCEYVFVQVCVC